MKHNVVNEEILGANVLISLLRLDGGPDYVEYLGEVMWLYDAFKASHCCRPVEIDGKDTIFLTGTEAHLLSQNPDGSFCKEMNCRFHDQNDLSSLVKDYSFRLLHESQVASSKRLAKPAKHQPKTFSPEPPEGWDYW